MSYKILGCFFILALSLSSCTENTGPTSASHTLQDSLSSEFKSKVKEVAFAIEMHCLEKGQSPGQDFFDKVLQEVDGVKAEIEVIQTSKKACEVEIKITSVKGEAATLTLPL